MPIEGPWAKWAEKYFIHEESVVAERADAKEGWKPFWQMTVQEARRQSTLCSIVPPGVIPYEGLIKEVIVPVPHLPQGVPVSVYKPKDLPAVPLIVVYIHGGGLVFGNRAESDPLVKKLATMLPAIILNIEYRLLPCDEGPLAPFDDCVAVTKWLLENKEAVGAHEASKVALLGCSAGGQIASTITYSIKKGVDFQVMVYPVTDVKCDTESCKEFYDDFCAFSTRSMEKIIEVAGIGTEEMIKDPRVNPAARTDLETCPPTLMILAPLDPLRDWGIDFANRLKAANVDTEVVTIDGVPHGFFNDMILYPKTSDEAHQHMKRFLDSRM